MKRILLLSILSLFLLSGCNQSNQNSASQSFKENDLDFTKTLEEEIKNVNLTGNGGDLIKAAYYTLNDDISFTILQVTLSTVKAKLFCPEIAGLFCRIAGLFCHDSRANLSLKPVCFGIAIS